MACQTCHGLAPKNFHSEQKLDKPQLQQIQVNDCLYCRLLCEIFDCFIPAWRSGLRSYDLYKYSDKTTKIRPIVPLSANTDPDVFEIEIYTTSGLADWPVFEVAPDLDSDPCSASTWRFIRSSLQDCNNEHRELCGATGPKPLPKRVISISSSPTPHLKLLEPEEGRAEVYAALSYCWGGSQPFVLTSASLDSRKSEILWEDLSTLHRDAIEVAQRFEIHYIWIDALCILQDSKDDWEVESARMGDYYGNAYVTISADMCRNPTISFLSPRPEHWMARTFTLPDGNSIKARRTRISRFEDIGPLASRAWAWQEKVLSPRLVHFTERDVFWQCRKEMLQEDAGRIPAMSPYGRHSFGEFPPTENTEEWWNEAIQDYSSRKLTFGKDKLPAISAIAAKLSKINEQEYLAGLWKKNLLWDLLWVSLWGSGSDNSSPLKRIEGAPSWSWASIDGPVENKSRSYGDAFRLDVQEEATLLDAVCEVSGLNPFGEVTGGSLTVKGPLVGVTLVGWAESGVLRCLLKRDTSPTVDISPDMWLEETGGSTAEVPKIKTVRRSDRKTRGTLSVPAFCLFVFTRNHEGLSQPLRHALVLGWSSTAPDAFERLGVLQSNAADQFFKDAKMATVRIA